MLDQTVEPLADEVRVPRAEAQAKVVALRRATPPVDAAQLRRAEAKANAVRRHIDVSDGAKSWGCHEGVAARIEAMPKGLEVHYAVTKQPAGSAWVRGHETHAWNP